MSSNIEKTYSEFIVELDRQINNVRRNYRAKIEQRALVKILNTLRDQHMQGIYPNIEPNSKEANRLKKAFAMANAVVSEEEFEHLILCFQKQNYFKEAMQELPMISELDAYKENVEEIDKFFADKYNRIYHFIVHRGHVREADIMELAKNIEQLTSIRSLLGEEGFTAPMNQEKIDRIFRIIDFIGSPASIDYKIAILHKAVEQDYNLHKVSVNRIEETIEEMNEKTIEEEQIEAEAVEEEIPEVEEFSDDDYAIMFDLDFETDDDKEYFFNIFNTIYGSDSKTRKMVAFAERYWKEMAPEIKEFGLTINNSESCINALQNVFTDEHAEEFGENFYTYKSAILIKQNLEAILMDYECDKLSCLGIFIELFNSGKIKIDENGITFTNEVEEPVEEIEEEEELDFEEDQLNIDKKIPLFFIDPQGFVNDTQPKSMGKEYRKKVYSILKDLMEDNNLGSRHSYSESTGKDSHTLSEYGVIVAKKGGKTRCYYIPIKNSNNEIVANILVLPYVTSKDSKTFNDEKRIVANMLPNHREDIDYLKDIVARNDLIAISAQEEISDQIISDMASSLRQEYVQGGVK